MVGGVLASDRNCAKYIIPERSNTSGVLHLASAALFAGYGLALLFHSYGIGPKSRREGVAPSLDRAESWSSEGHVDCIGSSVGVFGI